MKLKVLQKNDEKIVFEIDKVSYAFVNALRRAFMYHIPVLAIEEVYITKNSSLFDEALANRLGLIPLRWKGEIPEEGVKIILRKKGPCKVYSRDLKMPKGVEVANPNIPITILLEGQEVDLEAIAKIGYGYEHAKWQASLSSYKNAVRIEVRDSKKLNDILEDLPGKPLYLENEEVKMREGIDPAFYHRIEELSNGLIKIEVIPDKFIFTVESVSGLTPEEIIFKGIEILNKDLEEFEKRI